MGSHRWLGLFRVVFVASIPVLFLADRTAAQASFEVLHRFAGGADGSSPYGPPLPADDGHLYGMTTGGLGGINPDIATFFRLTTNGAVSTLNSAIPGWVLGRLVQGSDGDFYGTIYGGDGGYGSVFRITRTGAFSTLHRFDGANGSGPHAGLIRANDGAFYGTTRYGGAFKNGTVYKMTPDGVVTVLYSFAGGSDGSQPLAPLVEGPDGNLYGTTLSGGGSSNCSLLGPGCGTVYRITPSGVLTVLHAFIGEPSDGQWPEVGMVKAADGHLYGTTRYGGTMNCVVNGEPGGCGTIFKIDGAGTYSIAYRFSAGPTGSHPTGELIQAVDGNLYGTTDCSPGEFCGDGLIFQMTPAGEMTVLHRFQTADGLEPYGVVQAADRKFYGATLRGGNSGRGTLFRLRLIRPFTDDTLTAGGFIRAIHVIELRSRIDALRGQNQLVPFEWTDAGLGAGTEVRAVHLTEMRTALAEVYAAAQLTPPTYGDEGVVPRQTPVRAIHIVELRAAVVALE